MSEQGVKEFRFENPEYWKPPTPENPAVRLDKKSREFYTALETFPQAAQNLIASLSSIFLEADVFEEFKNNKGSISGLRKRFKSQGLTPGQITRTLDFFGLPYEKPKHEPR